MLALLSIVGLISLIAYVVNGSSIALALAVIGGIAFTVYVSSTSITLRRFERSRKHKHRR